MDYSHFMIDHVRFESDKLFEEVSRAFERQLGTFDPNVRVGNAGIRSHSLLATLLGLAAANASRTRIAGEVVQAVVGRGVYSASREDLTPILSDPLSLLPLSIVIGDACSTPPLPTGCPPIPSQTTP